MNELDTRLDSMMSDLKAQPSKYEQIDKDIDEKAKGKRYIVYLFPSYRGSPEYFDRFWRAKLYSAKMKLKYMGMMEVTIHDEVARKEVERRREERWKIVHERVGPYPSITFEDQKDKWKLEKFRWEMEGHRIKSFNEYDKVVKEQEDAGNPDPQYYFR